MLRPAAQPLQQRRSPVSCTDGAGLAHCPRIAQGIHYLVLVCADFDVSTAPSYEHPGAIPHNTLKYKTTFTLFLLARNRLRARRWGTCVPAEDRPGIGPAATIMR